MAAPDPFAPDIRPYHAWHEPRVRSCLEHLARMLPDRRPLRVLDLGHDPEMGQRMQAMGLSVTGNIHPSQDRPSVTWTLAPFDFEHPWPLPAAEFDVVTAFEVIEHVTTTPRHLLKEARRVLKPGGVLYLGTPNVTSWTKVRRMFSHAHPYDASAYSLDFGPRHPMCHVYEYDVWTLKRLVESEGFSIASCETWNPYPTDPRGLRDSFLRLLVSGSLAVTGHVKTAAQLWRHRGHQIGLAAHAK